LSRQGHHIKVASLLDDPDFSNKILAYLCLNKWVTNPKKLAAFHNNKLLPSEAKNTSRSLWTRRWPCTMKHHLKLELFPHIHIKVGKGVSVSTAH